MTAAAARSFRLLSALAAALFLSGCAGLATLQAVTEPYDLYDLTPKSTFDEQLPVVSAQIVIEEPTAASSVNTDRIAVRPNPLQVQYFPGARWVDRAPALVQTLLVESFENTGKVGAVGRQAIGLTSDYTLVPELREFQAELRSGETDGGAMDVNVRLNLKIVRNPQGLIIGSRSFACRRPAASDAVLDIVATFDTCLGKAMRRAAEWSLREIHAAGG